MTVLDSLRSWKDRNQDAAADDWRVAQGNGWRTDLDESDVIADGRRIEDADEAAVVAAHQAGLPLTSIDRQTLARVDHRAAARRNYGHLDAVRNRPIVPDNRATLARVAKISPDLFIKRRPRGDSLVYVLLRELSELDPKAASAGRDWYDRNRENLSVDDGSAWILRIRAKIAAAKATPAPGVQSPKANAWAEWRKVAQELFEVSGHHTGIRFAVPTEDGAVNNLAFWWITRGRGDREGMFFLRQVIGGQGPVRVRIGPEAMVAVARKALMNPTEAMATYGREIGCCARCGRELTNETSRAAGIGPECRKH